MTVELIILIVYFGILFAIGIAASRQIKGLDDFYVGGKKLGFWVVAFSSRATGESAWLLLGLTGMGALVGMKAMWVVVGEVIGVLVAWQFMAKPFKRITDKYDSVTIPDYLVSHFKPKTHALRAIAAAILPIFVVIYISAQIDATGKAFESFLEWDYFVGAIVGFFIVVAYSFIGGFVAVVWSDFFQGLLMLLGLVALPIVAYINYPGDSLMGDLYQIAPHLTSWWGEEGFTWLNILSIIGLLAIGLGFLGSPQVFVRFMSVKSEREIEKGRWVALAFTVLADIGAVLIGMYARSVFYSEGQAVPNNGEDSLIMMITEFMPKILVGVYVAVILSAIMSTIDSLLVVASSAITRDFYQKIFRPELKQETMAKISRNVTLILALAGLVLALTIALLVEDRTIFWFVIFGWTAISCTFCPMIILSLSWKKYNTQGAIASMLAGAASVLLIQFVLSNSEIVGSSIGDSFSAVEPMFPSFIISFLAGIIATHATFSKSSVELKS